LASMGINRFSASIILCQISLEEFLNLEPEERIARFGEFIGTDLVVCGFEIRIEIFF
jgi:hypothetical protein